MTICVVKICFPLLQFSSIVNFMLAICYREVGDAQLQNFEQEVIKNNFMGNRNYISTFQVRGGHGMNRELHRLFDNLAGWNTDFVASAGGGGKLTFFYHKIRGKYLLIFFACSRRRRS